VVGSGALRRYLPFLLTLLLFPLARVVSAQSSAGFALDRFQPAPTTEDGLALTLPRTLGHLRPGATLTFDYAHQPLVLSKQNADADGAIVKNRLVGHVVAALGLGERFELFVHVPVTLTQSGDDPAIGGIRFPDPNSAAFGDIWLGGTVRLLGEDRSPFQLGLQAAVSVPSGNPDALSGDDGVGALGKFTAAYHRESWSFAANLGGRYRPTAAYGSARIGTELLFGLGAYFRANDHVTLLGEWYGASTFRDAQLFTSPGTASEVLAGVRWSSPIKLVITAALGAGLTQAVGEPDVRALLQFGYPPPRPPLAPPDRDKDGVLDDVDACPDIPEDKDEFQDEDGCPDPDNDQDGIADVNDACPLDPEDIDGFADQDGCPEADNDKDGIVDRQDKCPNSAEDKDGFADEDGCPDLDNDQDGIRDESDQCPLDPEDLDGFADDDGCPDPDNDKDGIPDAEDNCPTVPGPAHTKGCPSAVRIDRSQIRILQRIEFETNRAEIRPDSLGIIDQVRGALEVNPQIKKIRIEGHTDSRGSNEKNLKLSQRRAESVMQYLVAEGINPERLEAKGWGEEHPLVANDTPENMQTNRRVEFHIVDPAPPSEDSQGAGSNAPSGESGAAPSAPKQPADSLDLGGAL
jgi:outer membrane protein OmpA-like peptidoglycan-associated protein